MQRGLWRVAREISRRRRIAATFSSRLASCRLAVRSRARCSRSFSRRVASSDSRVPCNRPYMGSPVDDLQYRVSENSQGDLVAIGLAKWVTCLRHGRLQGIHHPPALRPAHEDTCRGHRPWSVKTASRYASRRRIACQRCEVFPRRARVRRKYRGNISGRRVRAANGRRRAARVVSDGIGKVRAK
jgi:hypothetical protein